MIRIKHKVDAKIKNYASSIDQKINHKEKVFQHFYQNLLAFTEGNFRPNIASEDVSNYRIYINLNDLIESTEFDFTELIHEIKTGKISDEALCEEVIERLFDSFYFEEKLELDPPTCTINVADFQIKECSPELKKWLFQTATSEFVNSFNDQISKEIKQGIFALVMKNKGNPEKLLQKSIFNNDGMVSYVNDAIQNFISENLKKFADCVESAVTELARMIVKSDNVNVVSQTMLYKAKSEFESMVKEAKSKKAHSYMEFISVVEISQGSVSEIKEQLSALEDSFYFERNKWGETIGNGISQSCISMAKKRDELIALMDSKVKDLFLQLADELISKYDSVREDYLISEPRFAHITLEAMGILTDEIKSIHLNLNLQKYLSSEKICSDLFPLWMNSPHRLEIINDISVILNENSSHIEAGLRSYITGKFVSKMEAAISDIEAGFSLQSPIKFEFSANEFTTKDLKPVLDIAKGVAEIVLKVTPGLEVLKTTIEVIKKLGDIKDGIKKHYAGSNPNGLPGEIADSAFKETISAFNLKRLGEINLLV